MPSPLAMLEKKLTCTKPGSVAAALEFDFGVLAMERFCAAMSEFNHLLEGCHSGSRPQPTRASSRRQGSGSRTHDVGFHRATWRPYSSGSTRGFWRGRGDRYRGPGAHTEALRKEMTEAGTDGRYYCLTPIVLGAWQRGS